MIERTLKVVPTVRELATEFCDCSSTEQAEFFNHCAELMREWKIPYGLQLRYVSEEKILTDEARSLMEDIGNHCKI